MISYRLGTDDRVLESDRDQLYYLNVPYFYVHASFENVVNVGIDNRDISMFESQIETQGVNHVLTAERNPGSGEFSYLTQGLRDAGCLRKVGQVDAPSVRRNIDQP